MLITGLGTAALLVAPIFIAGELVSFTRAEINAFTDAWTDHDKYKILITRTQTTAHISADYCRTSVPGQGYRPTEIA